MRPRVVRITEADPRRRRIHVVGEAHPGELSGRGYVKVGEEWVLDVRRPAGPGRDADPVVEEFRALSNLGYEFAEGDEWSPLELFRKYRERGLLRGDGR
jgi:hypothetical protein